MSLDSEEYGALPEIVESRPRSYRTVYVAATIVGTMLAAVILLSSNGDESPVEEIAISPNQKLDRLVDRFVKQGADMSVGAMEKQLDDWRNNPSTILDLDEGNRVESLTGLAAGVHKSLLAGNPSLCAKKALIIQKFDQLLQKLGSEELTLNITNQAIENKKTVALKAWLDSESDYRLTEQKAENAKEGAAYAREQYEKYDTAYRDASTAANSLRSTNDEERRSLLDEKELIQQIMVMLGLLTNSTSAAAAVKGSTKLYQAPPMPSAVRAELRRLESMASKVPQAGMGRYLKRLKTSLAGNPTAEAAGEVALILKQMLQDITERLRVLNNLDSSAQSQSNAMQAKLVEWQTKLVDISNAADKADAAAEAQSLQRQTLAGEKKQADASADQEKAAYKLMLPPYMKEIYVINLIKAKILSSCAA